MRTRWRSISCLALLLSLGCSNGGSAAPDVAAGDQGVDVPADALMDAAVRDASLMDADDAVRDVRVGDRGPNRMILDFGVDPDAVPPPQSECTDAGTAMRPGDPGIAPPRPVLPQSASRASSWRPSFHWLLPDGVTGARVEVCRDRCCTQVIRTLDGEGTSVRPTEALPPGVVFWRLFGRRGGAFGSRPSATWEFNVPRRDTPVDASSGQIRDFDGDGAAEVLVKLTYWDDRTPWFLKLRYRGGGPLLEPIDTRYLQATGTMIGDFSGDGLSDALHEVQESDPLDIRQGRIGLMLGNRERVALGGLISGGMRPRGSWIEMVAHGDFNGDGYDDLLTYAALPCEGTDCGQGANFTGEAGSFVYLGSNRGLVPIPQWRLPLLTATDLSSARGLLGDVNGDGLADGLVIETTQANDIYTTSPFLASLEPSRVVRIVSLPRPPGFVGSEPRVRSRPVADIDGDSRSEIVFPDAFSRRFDLVMSAGGYRTVFSRHGGSGPEVTPSYGAGSVSVDLDGDGYRDLVVPDFRTYNEYREGRPINVGRVNVYRGSASGIADEPTVVRPPPEIGAGNSAFGADVVDAGDLNQDGFDDIAILVSGDRAICLLLGRSGVLPSMPDHCLPVQQPPPSGQPVRIF